MHGASGGRAARQGRMNGARVMSKVHVGLWSQQRSFQHAWAVIASAMRARDVRRELNQVARLGDARAKVTNARSLERCCNQQPPCCTI